MDRNDHSIDDLAWSLARSLLEDFEPFVDSDFYTRMLWVISKRNIEQLRRMEFSLTPSRPVLETKIRYQLLNLFKKYTFSKDVYTEIQVLEDSKKKFLDNQARINSLKVQEDSTLKSILFSARGYVEDILGDFSKFDVLERARFGKKSSVGIPMRKACEGERYEAPITGSDDHIQWFDKLYACWNRPAYNYAVERAVNRKVPLTLPVDILEAVLVNKTWKSKRLIMPNTTLGTLYSGGLGRLLEDKLRAYGYDIRSLQATHGELARFGSITGSLVTADQSLASDNITVWLVDRICPAPWASALKFGRIRKVSFYGSIIETETFSTMGIGFTFPLQTLVFLSLLLAIRDHVGLNESSVISVYGDDLIYPVEMHSLVLDIFDRLGLKINVDKTFADGYFRESCGQDYYRGVDIRPFLFGGDDDRSYVGRRRYEALLYKTFNGLIRRWNPYEIPGTCRFLLSEFGKIKKDGKPLFVPSDYPDTSGIRDCEHSDDLEDYVRHPTRDVHGRLTFQYLAFEPDLRKDPELRHAPYLWARLSQLSQSDRLAELGDSHITPPGLTKLGLTLDEITPFFKDVESKGRTFRSELTGKRIRYFETFLPEQKSGRYRERTGVTGNWTPVMRRK